MSQEFSLGLIAVATVVMAVVQVGLIVMVVRLARRVDTLSAQVEREIGPLAAKLALVADNLQHATALAAVQIERLDRLFAGASTRADATMSLVQSAVIGPLREGLAVVAALRGVIGAVRAFKGSRAAKAAARLDDEDPLFIG